MDIVFISKGKYNSKTEQLFQRLKQQNPDIKRIHGLSFYEALKLSSQIVDSLKFCLIDTLNPYLYSEHEVEKVVIDPLNDTDQGKEDPNISVQRVIMIMIYVQTYILDTGTR